MIINILSSMLTLLFRNMYFVLKVLPSNNYLILYCCIHEVHMFFHHNNSKLISCCLCYLPAVQLERVTIASFDHCLVTEIQLVYFV